MEALGPARCSTVKAPMTCVWILGSTCWKGRINSWTLPSDLNMHILLLRGRGNQGGHACDPCQSPCGGFGHYMVTMINRKTEGSSCLPNIFQHRNLWDEKKMEKLVQKSIAGLGYPDLPLHTCIVLLLPPKRRCDSWSWGCYKCEPPRLASWCQQLLLCWALALSCIYCYILGSVQTHLLSWKWQRLF